MNLVINNSKLPAIEGRNMGIGGRSQYALSDKQTTKAYEDEAKRDLSKSSPT